jgi:hypothetical protein
VKQLIERTPEPAISEHVRVLLDRLDARLSPAQRDELLRWDDAVPHPADTINAVRRDIDSAERLRDRAVRFAEAAGRTYNVYDRIDDAVAVIGQARAKPAVASALVWHLIGGRDEDLTSHLVQVIRERAGLARLTTRIRGQDLGPETASVPELVVSFADRQVADACARIEAVPAPFGPEDAATLNRQMAAIADARNALPRVTVALVSGFAKRAAAFLVELSTRKLDPLGFALGRDLQLDHDPPLARRVEIAAWARRAGHLVSPRGALLVLRIPIMAPWPWHLELIAAEPGHGASGCVALLLRLASDATPPPTSRTPVLLFVPDEGDDERGARFERWLAIAYPSATAEWRAWM